MSQWYEPKKDDMFVDKESGDLCIHFDSDYNGAIYIEVKIKDVLEVIKESEN